MGSTRIESAICRLRHTLEPHTRQSIALLLLRIRTSESSQNPISRKRLQTDSWPSSFWTRTFCPLPICGKGNQDSERLLSTTDSMIVTSIQIYWECVSIAIKKMGFECTIVICEAESIMPQIPAELSLFFHNITYWGISQPAWVFAELIIHWRLVKPWRNAMGWLCLNDFPPPWLRSTAKIEYQ